MKPYVCSEASSATAFSNKVATCLTKFNNYILFTTTVFIALREGLEWPVGDKSHARVVTLQSFSQLPPWEKMMLTMSLKMVHQKLHLPALDPAASKWTGWKQVAPWKMSDTFSGPVIQVPSRKLISKGEHFCYWNSWMPQKVFLIFLSPT